MDIIEELIAKRPQLEDMLRLYERSIHFADEVKALVMPLKPNLTAYPPEFTSRIIGRFHSVFDLPEGSLAPLKQALELGEVDFTRLPLLEVPAFSLPYPEDDLTMLLFLFSRPYFLAMKDSVQQNDRCREEGKCFVCGSRPVLRSVSPEGLLRQHCSFCGTEGRSDAVGCPVCHNTDASRLSAIELEQEEGFRIQTCDQCRSYVKTVDSELLRRMSPDLADLISLPLDVVAQGKGYRRHSPNPIGMVRMSACG